MRGNRPPGRDGQRVLDVLSDIEPATPWAVAERMGWPYPRVKRTLHRLSRKSLVVSGPGRVYETDTDDPPTPD